MSHVIGTPPLQRLSLTPQTLAKVIKSKVRSTERPPQASPLISDPSQVLLPQSNRDFAIRRTAANWLPVYRAFRHHNRVLTKIRRIDGNVAVWQLPDAEAMCDIDLTHAI